MEPFPRRRQAARLADQPGDRLHSATSNATRDPNMWAHVSASAAGSCREKEVLEETIRSAKPFGVLPGK